VATLSDGDGTVLSQQDVASQLASDQAAGDRAGLGDATPTPSEATTTPASPQASGGVPAGGAPGTTAIVRSRAGTLAVRCAGEQITLDRWTPNAGYRVDDVTRTATQVSVWFESDVTDDVEAVVRCADGSPLLKEIVEIDDNGGGRRGGGGSGRG
jgi:hypothetical protein